MRAHSSLLSRFMSHPASWVIGDNVLGLPKYLPSGVAWWLSMFAPVRSANPHIHSCFGKTLDVPDVNVHDANDNSHLDLGFLYILGKRT